jgi:multicomponent K+:H+ antiporter subunit A/multicomponent Na+:H+ antiporter subunit A
MVKAVVVLIAKMGFLFEVAPFSQVVLYVGLATMFWGAYLALRQDDLKALLAYSTISQLGLLTALYGAGHPFAATAHLINHAVFKAALFMVVGIVDHSAGSREIGTLSGLWRKLPLTTMLAIPAALSMAGLPPFGGFISKELFFEEMLHEGTLPTIIAVTGSIMTFAYSMRFLKVFFGRFRCENPNVHEASLPFLAPLVPLSVAVILFGLVPWDATIATWFTDLAAISFGYEGETLYLWHGLGLALALSVLSWFSGMALHLIRDHFVAVQARLTPSWNANTVYYQLLAGLERFAVWLTNLTQGATFTTHLRLIWGAFALVGLGVASSAFLLSPNLLPPSPVPLSLAVVALLILASVAGVLSARSRFSALIFMGLAGFGSTLVFVLLRAPDLALTQLLIEVVTVILFLSVFRFLPVLKRYSRPAPVALIDAVISLGVAFTVFVALVKVQTPLAPRIEDYFLSFSKELGGGYNVVNVILVDFRGYDTMGEITVLAIVAVSVLALIRLRFKRSQAGHQENRGER